MLVYWIWYALLPELSLRQKCQILQYFSDPEDIYHTESFRHIQELTPEAVATLENKDLTTARQVVKNCKDKHIGILTFRDAAYPSRLRNIPDPPLVLYYKGILPDFELQPTVAVVGTRKASPYGLRHARSICRELAACGGLVISGGAAGVDSMALQGALDVGAQTVAVLGCGVDVVYPRTNRKLFADIEAKGCLLSEYLPGTQPLPWQFPARNRIISGLAAGALVVEAPEKSGALITARSALEQGRDVFVIPGNIDAVTSAGSNALLRDGASAVFTGWDVLRDYAPAYPDTVCKRTEPEIGAMQSRAKVAQPVVFPWETEAGNKKVVDNPIVNAYSDLENTGFQPDAEEKQILACLTSSPRPMDDVIAQAGLPAGKVLSILTRLSVKGVVIQHPGRLVSVNLR